MSTFLELCQNVSRESGVISGVLPTAVTGQSGLLLNIVEWTAQAWTLIQNLHTNWDWMHSTYTKSTTSGVGTYTPTAFSITSLRTWAPDLPEEQYYPHTSYLTSDGVAYEAALVQISYKQYRTRYQRGTQTNNAPTEWAISPANEIMLGPIPDADYTIQGEYYKQATVLAANGDIPAMPTYFHDMVVWRALMLMGGYDEANFQLSDATAKYDEYLERLTKDQLPRLRLGGGPLA